MFKNLKKEKKTTILGIVQIILFALVSFSVVTTDESSELARAASIVIDSLGGTWAVATGSILTVVGSIFLMFAKDPGSKNTE
jgi:uncharacterized membrane protein